jgi:hypothetical protein
MEGPVPARTRPTALHLFLQPSGSILLFFVVGPCRSVTFCVDKTTLSSQRYSGCYCKDAKRMPNAVATRPRDVPQCDRLAQRQRAQPLTIFVLQYTRCLQPFVTTRPSFPIRGQVPLLIALRSLWPKDFRIAQLSTSSVDVKAGKSRCST